MIPQDLILTTPTLPAPLAIMLATSSDPGHGLDSPAFLQRCVAACYWHAAAVGNIAAWHRGGARDAAAAVRHAVVTYSTAEFRHSASSQLSSVLDLRLQVCQHGGNLQVVCCCTAPHLGCAPCRAAAGMCCTVSDSSSTAHSRHSRWFACGASCAGACWLLLVCCWAGSALIMSWSAQQHPCGC